MLTSAPFGTKQPAIFHIAARVLLVAMVVIGLGFCLGSGYFLWRTKAWMDRSAPATGTVAAQSMSMSAARGPAGPAGRGVSGSAPSTRAEVVEFTTSDGVRHQFRSRISSSDPFAVGAEVPVRYNPADPTDATIDTWFRVWGFPLIFLAVGACQTSFGLVFLAMSRRIGGPRGA